MTRSLNEREKFVDILKEIPILTYACKQARLSRTTIYRWMKSNPDFADKVYEALKLGRESVNDLAEISLIQKVQNKDMKATMYWLQHNHPTYIPKRTVYVEPPNEPRKRRNGVPCKDCGHVVNKGFDPGGPDYSKKKKRKEMVKEMLHVQYKKTMEKEAVEKFNRVSNENWLKMWDDAAKNYVAEEVGKAKLKEAAVSKKAPEVKPKPPILKPKEPEVIEPVVKGPGVHEKKPENIIYLPPPKNGVQEA